MGIRSRLAEPAGIVLAVVLGGVCGALVAARGPGWLVIPVGVTVAGVVLGVKVAIDTHADRRRQLREQQHRQRLRDQDGSTARAVVLLSNAGDVATQLREQAATRITDPMLYPDVDTAVRLAGQIVNAVYRLACLVTRRDARNGLGDTMVTDVLDAMDVAADRLADVLVQLSAAESGTARFDQLVDDLKDVHTYLRRTAEVTEASRSGI